MLSFLSYRDYEGTLSQPISTLKAQLVYSDPISLSSLCTIFVFCLFICFGFPFNEQIEKNPSTKNVEESQEPLDPKVLHARMH